MVSTPLKNISQNGNLPQLGLKIKKIETTTQLYNVLFVSPNKKWWRCLESVSRFGWPFQSRRLVSYKRPSKKIAIISKRSIGNEIRVHVDTSHSRFWLPLVKIVDGRNAAHQLRLVVPSIIYRVLYIPGGAGFLPPTVASQVWEKMTGIFWWWFFGCLREKPNFR